MTAGRRLAHHLLRASTLTATFALASLQVCQPAGAVDIQFDYSRDKLGFFDDPARRDLLNLAASFVNRFVDGLEPIEPAAGKSWSVYPALPPHGSKRYLNDLVIPANTLTIYAGGNNALPDRYLAEGSDAEPIWRAGPPEWEDTINARGQTGALQSPATDYGPWGGVITFNADRNEVEWHFGNTTDNLDPHEFDFLTVAMHELTHLLGFGLADSFQAHVDNGSDGLRFIGQDAVALSATDTNNTDLLLHDGGHWAIDTFGRSNGDRIRALMGPIINPGKRLYPTTLDRAALRDIGWQEGLPGDANLDGQFDSLDVVQVLQAATYGTGEIAGWSEGNWNDDAVVDQLDIVAALSTGVFLTGPYASLSTAISNGEEQTPVLSDAKFGLNTVFDATFTSGITSYESPSAAMLRVDETVLLGESTGIVGFASLGPGDAALNAIFVPEPSGMLLVCLGALAALLTVQRRNHA